MYSQRIHALASLIADLGRFVPLLLSTGLSRAFETSLQLGILLIGAHCAMPCIQSYNYEG